MRENSEFFNIIDTEEKAYILGFISADGNILYNPSERRYVCKIQINKKDVDVLYKIKKALECNRDIKFRKEMKDLPQGGQSLFDSCSLIIYNKKLVESLINLGVTPKKSLTLDIDFTKIKKECMRDFIRGFVDGNGSFGEYRGHTENRVYSTFAVVGSNILMNNIKNFLDKELKINLGIIKQGKISRIYTKNKTDFYNLLYFLYNNSSIYMDRKFANYNSINQL